MEGCSGNSEALGPSEVRVVVLDIRLPTGFSPELSDLEKVTGRDDHVILITLTIWQRLGRISDQH
ncbi:hypothetical protein EYF80_063827 [Liparis tanakae]|uniref:Uncharacterized protein n=1 Tax=Liparis tanakae TaxID=230148 RepID=A0A4Z2EAX8_9TELE|nr:hypothetical protein EYF80_063827 [Liparis tanakae]